MVDDKTILPKGNLFMVSQFSKSLDSLVVLSYKELVIITCISFDILERKTMFPSHNLDQ